MTEPSIYEFEIDEYEIGERLDKVITQRLSEFSRNQIQQLIKDSQILVNQQPSKPAYRLEPADFVTIPLPETESNEVLAEDIPLEVLYEDDDIVVINKPAGMVVHPAHGNRTGTLVNALLHRWPEIQYVGDDPDRVGIIHRLDKETSGVIIVALTEAAREYLSDQFQARTIDKHYLALIERHPPNDKGRIDAAIGRNPVNVNKWQFCEMEKKQLQNFLSANSMVNGHCLTFSQNRPHPPNTGSFSIH